ncbi:MAG: WD40 repeat domain-containing protein [Bacteroidetes bacterium]|nr:WD40 repeat domain-containing protein [Bacteroidota bacterium]
MVSVQVNKLHTFTGHTDSIYTLQAADQPNLFFSGAGDGMIALWDLQARGDGELIARLPNSVYSLLHLHEQKQLIAGQNFSGLHLIDYKNKKEVASLQVTSSAIFDIRNFGNDIIIATGDGVVSVIDLEQWSLKKRMAHAEKSARTIAINPTAGEMAVGYSDNFIRIFSLDSYELKHEINAHQNSVFTLIYSPDWKQLLSGSRDARLKVWNADSGYSLHQEVAAHLFAINHLTFSPDGKYLASASMDKSVKVWDAATLQLLKVIDKGRHAGHGTSVNKLLWTSFNSQLISAGDDRIISAWDLLFL